MALDGANFIAELSITDPPGSDPLSQGDDQIRTIKRATFQSFPLIAAAVNLTDVQMNNAAIKNEANDFIGDQSILGNLTFTQPDADTATILNFNDNLTVLRWQMSVSNANAAAPQQFSLVRFDAAGAFLDVPWKCDAVTGIINFDEVPTIQGDPIWTAGEIKMLVQGASPPSTNWFVCNGTNGTVDLRDRIMGAQGVFTGTQSPFLDAQTDVGPITGSTVISEAQMPSHTHDLMVSDNGTILELGKVGANQNTFGMSNATLNRRFSNTAGGGDRIIDDTGGGGGHTHTIPELEVNPASNDAFQVMPFTYFMQVIQYVP